MFVTLEGTEGAGKSTLARWLRARLVREGHAVTLTHEPGGTVLGDELRQMIKHSAGLALTAQAETLLLCASRAQLVEEVILPRLKSGDIVICDRYADSTLAYQCYGRGLEVAPVKHVIGFATRGISPDLTVLLDVDVAEGLGRKRNGGRETWDRFENAGIAFHERVRRGYLELAAAEPSRWLVIDASRPMYEVQQRVWGRVRHELAARGSNGVRTDATATARGEGGL